MWTYCELSCHLFFLRKDVEKFEAVAFCWTANNFFLPYKVMVHNLGVLLYLYTLSFSIGGNILTCYTYDSGQIAIYTMQKSSKSNNNIKCWCNAHMQQQQQQENNKISMQQIAKIWPIQQITTAKKKKQFIWKNQKEAKKKRKSNSTGLTPSSLRKRNF